ncbi:hypothetical protein TH25_14565 [Thalassospira profundimaris]|uniref:Uncharacterized protein n=1 Tax=Thalassospira profundimaris TaxID=502049 RepID=A0A367X3N4_9PROT|nr:hypothetical protein TH25_14565 [Thalassospira profundimaris]
MPIEHLPRLRDDVFAFSQQKQVFTAVKWPGKAGLDANPAFFSGCSGGLFGEDSTNSRFDAR